MRIIPDLVMTKFDENFIARNILIIELSTYSVESQDLLKLNRGMKPASELETIHGQR